MSCQAKFLRVIQERQFVQVGGNNQVHVDFWLNAAMNKNLREEVTGGRFRSDLDYRLNVISIESPPLKKRREELSMVMNYSWPSGTAISAGLPWRARESRDSRDSRKWMRMPTVRSCA